MNSKGIIIGVVGLLMMAAFVGIIQPATAAPSDVTPSADDRYALPFLTSQDGTQICSQADPGMPYGNITWYHIRTDVARCPEEYMGYIVEPGNGHGYNSGYYYLNTNFGLRLTAPWLPTDMYYAVAEIGPAAWGGHHPTATQNYTQGIGAIWDEDGEMFFSPNLYIQPIPTLTAVGSGANAVLTWTDLNDNNTVITGYPVYRKVGAGAWTYVTTVAEGLQTYTDVGTWVAGNKWAIGVAFADGYRIKGRSNVEPYFVSDAIPPVSNAGPDQVVTAGATVTFDGSASTDNIGVTGYSWTFTDVTPQTLSGVGPTYVFNNVGVFTVTLDVNDLAGNHDLTPDTMTVTVNPAGDLIDPVANAGPDQVVNEDTVVTFDGSASTDNIGVTGWTWTFTDGVLRTLTGVAPTYTFATPGVYTVTLSVRDAAGNVDDTPDTMTVTVNDNSPILVTDTSPGSVEPGVGFDISCVGSDYQLLAVGDITLYWEDVLGVQVGPVAASTFTSVSNDQMTKADDGNELKDTHTWTWAIPAQAVAGEVHYWFATDDGAGHTATEPVGATFLANYATVMVQVAGNQNQPHPLLGYVLDPLGVGLLGATVDATWYDSTEGLWFTMTTLTITDGLGNDGWFQIDIYHNNWTIGDLLYVNATFNIAGVDYYGYNTTLFASGDNILPDDDKEFVNVTIVIQEFFELKWTLGWNIWSHPMVRSENASLGLTDLPFSWFGAQHWMDTAQVGVGDDCTLVAWNGAAYVTFVYPLDNGSASDITVVLDYGYWAYVSESWFTDEAALAIPEMGILVPGQYVWRTFATRAVTVNAGWNLLGWTSFNYTFVATDVIMTLTTGAVSGDGIPQPEIVANWTSDDWEAGNTADMQHWEGAKGYTTFWWGGWSQSTPEHDFPVGPGYGFWVYSEVGGQTLTYITQ